MSCSVTFNVSLLIDRPFLTRLHQPDEQVPTYLTMTTEAVNELVRRHIELSYHVKEEVKGVRYCPSLEAKVIKFKNQLHQVWIEPEGGYFRRTYLILAWTNI